MIDCEKDCALYGSSSCAYPKFKHHSSCFKFEPKVMAKTEKKEDVKFLNSVALGLNDVDGKFQHVQITIAQDVDSKEFKVYFDVIDPTKVKLSFKE